MFSFQWIRLLLYLDMR